MNGIPVLFSIIMLLLTLIIKPLSSTLILIQTLTGLVIYPIYFLIANIFVIKRYNSNLVATSAIFLVSSILAIMIGYLNWGLASKRLFNPDQMTVTIYQLQVILAIVTYAIAIFIFKVKRRG